MSFPIIWAMTGLPVGFSVIELRICGFGIVSDVSPLCMNSCIPSAFGPVKPSRRKQAINSRRLIGPRWGIMLAILLPLLPDPVLPELVWLDASIYGRATNLPAR